VIAAVELRGDRAILFIVLRKIRVVEEKRDPPDLQPPDLGMTTRPGSSTPMMSGLPSVPSASCTGKWRNSG
jgi:hypothetical protein